MRINKGKERKCNLYVYLVCQSRITNSIGHVLSKWMMFYSIFSLKSFQLQWVIFAPHLFDTKVLLRLSMHILF